MTKADCESCRGVPTAGCPPHCWEKYVKKLKNDDEVFEAEWRVGDQPSERRHGETLLFYAERQMKRAERAEAKLKALIERNSIP